ncbi:MAG TPA: integrase family protein [Alicycliphilus sp.]|jgi:integrase|nr:integrase family protein [Alicycliphilus sp.]
MAKVPFTAGRIQSFTCPADHSQAFLWDTVAKGLGLRATPAGKPAYIFQGVHQGSSIRLTIGSPADWSIEQARGKAREFQRLIDQGMDPRQLKRDAIAAQAAAREEAQARAEADRQAAVLAADAWTVYLQARKPHWSERHYADHVRLSQAGGQEARRGTRGRGVTIAGPLHRLLAMRLGGLTPSVIEEWAAHEAALRPTVARLAWRHLKAFLSWCAEQPAYAPIVATTNPAKTRTTRESLGKARTKDDALLREQLNPWFDAVRALPNPIQSAYLQVLLLTGARPNEVLTLRRSDIDFRWNRLTIRDKVEGERQIPLTPYVKSLLAQLPAASPWVFPGKQTQPGAEPQPISKPHHAHERACKAAYIEHLTLHGLRRSFGTLSEWLEIPAGVVAQIQGHKPSATAEKHYRVRPLDLLRVHHERIEAWILEQAGIALTPPIPAAP